LWIEPGKKFPDLRDLFEGGGFADGGEFFRLRELGKVVTRYVRLDHYVCRLRE
jgi:hypothetical protein